MFPDEPIRSVFKPGLDCESVPVFCDFVVVFSDFIDGVILVPWGPGLVAEFVLTD
ncbi:hypothetical protein LEP1GSC045_0403 [Leptospira interrogans serovar Pomona str. Kennewicki LC82-25]|nr:hypothetical protein LEP1GSC045_0403 [Leptospira interrogans serovar Pomona str. Kennewicki LC82-25]